MEMIGSPSELIDGRRGIWTAVISWKIFGFDSAQQLDRFAITAPWFHPLACFVISSSVYHLTILKIRDKKKKTEEKEEVAAAYMGGFLERVKLEEEGIE